MKALTLTLILIAGAATALDLSQPVCRVTAQEQPIAGTYQSALPNEYGTTYPYRAATHRHEADGWRNVATVGTPDGDGEWLLTGTGPDGITATWEAAPEGYPTPESLVPTVSIVDSNFAVVGTAREFVDVETMESFYVVDRQSPQRGWVDEQLPDAIAWKASNAVERAQRQAEREKLEKIATPATVETIISNLGDVRLALTGIIARVDGNVTELQATAALTNGFTAADNRALVNALRREAIDMAIENQKQARELRAIRKALAQFMKLEDGE